MLAAPANPLHRQDSFHRSGFTKGNYGLSIGTLYSADADGGCRRRTADADGGCGRRTDKKKKTIIEKNLYAWIQVARNCT